MSFRSTMTMLCLLPIICGSIYALFCVAAVIRLSSRPPTVSRQSFSEWPPVTILKPIGGWGKKLRTNLRTTYEQIYPVFQVVLSVQDPTDPAIPCYTKSNENMEENESPWRLKIMRSAPMEKSTT